MIYQGKQIMHQNTQNKKIAITGATGFVGRKLCNALQNKELRLLVRRHEFSITAEQIICNLADLDLPSNALDDVLTVFHLAAVAHDGRDESKIENLYYRVNVEATIYLAKLAIESGVKKFVLISSVKAGGKPINGECSIESDQFEPEGVYGRTKREAELKLLEIASKSKMQVYIIRSALVYGPNLKGNLNLMMSGIKAGWFPPLPEIGNRRSMIHVDDLVRAILFLSNKESANGKIFNATDGKEYSSREIYDAMRFEIGKPISNWSIPKIIFDLIALFGDKMSYRVNKLLGSECYSSEKLNALGYRPKRSLKEINETFF
jgi:UDP-glucose 4-epimerase